MNDEHTYRKNYPEFERAFTAVYQDRTSKLSASDRLEKLFQTKSAAAYAAEFQSLCSILELDPETQISRFYHGLSTDVKKSLAIVGQPALFFDLVDKAISIDQRHQSPCQCPLGVGRIEFAARFAVLGSIKRNVAVQSLIKKSVTDGSPTVITSRFLPKSADGSRWGCCCLFNNCLSID
jgi:Retrotransposon gag protein